MSMNKYEIHLKELQNLKDSIFPTQIRQDKYSSDISWIGNPFKKPESHKIVKFIAIENFPLKIFFDVKSIIREVEPMMREYVTPSNLEFETYTLITYFSEIIVNSMIEDIRNLTTSAYANGFYISKYPEELESLFKINKNELPNDTHEMIVYKDLEDLEQILDYLLEHPDLRRKINENLKKKIESDPKKYLTWL